MEDSPGSSNVTANPRVRITTGEILGITTAQLHALTATQIAAPRSATWVALSGVASGASGQRSYANGIRPAPYDAVSRDARVAS